LRAQNVSLLQGITARLLSSAGASAVCSPGIFGLRRQTTPTVYYLVETVDFDAGSRLVRYVKAFDNLSDCVDERDRPSQSKRLACVAGGAPVEDT